MREKSMTFSTWYEGRLYDWWPEDQPAPPKDKLDDVQLCVVYEANTKYWREAVNDAWNKLRSGYPAHIEWYDGSPDRKWTMLFRPSYAKKGQTMNRSLMRISQSSNGRRRLCRRS
jgi:hypothetical protein